MKVSPLIMVIWLYCCSCTQRPHISEQKMNADTTAFFPVNDYLRAEIADIQQTPYLIRCVIMENNRLVDSLPISKKVCTDWANLFLKDSITNVSQHAFYTGNLFHDLSTQSYTFTYNALNDTLQVKMVNVLVSDENNKLKSVFIAASNTSDSVKEEKLIWTAGKSFRINRNLIRLNKEIEQNIFVNWNDK